MENKFRIRDARPQDAVAIREIYAPFVEGTVTSFEFSVPSVEVMTERITTTLLTHPYLVAEEDDLDPSGTTPQGQILGFAYATKYKDREGYKWVAEASIYLSPPARGKGLGSALYGKLFEILTQQGFYKVIAGISGSNPASERFHGKFGFLPVATWTKIGNKFGGWIDATWYVKELRDPSRNSNPAPPLTYPEWKKGTGENNRIRV